MHLGVLHGLEARVGNDGAPDGQGCGRPECAFAPHMGCMCGVYGRFVSVQTAWQSEGLRVHLTEYDNGTIFILIYGHAAMDERDVKTLDAYADVVTESQTAWTAGVPAEGVGARAHFYGVLV